MREMKIAPSLLSADFTRLAEEIKAVEQGGADMLHLDVMDGRFVGNITFGPMIVEAVNRLTELPLDTHLMIVEPEKYIDAFRKAGSDYITVHIETAENLADTLNYIKQLGAGAGLSLNPETPLETLKPYLSSIDLLLLMSVHPGFSGQAFIPESLDRIRKIAGMREESSARFLISVDGGVEMENAGDIASAGADILVAGSSIFHTESPEKAIVNLKAALGGL